MTGVVRRRVAIVQPVIIPGGGNEAVTAWAIEAMKDECKVSLITFSKNLTADDLNRYHGTAIRPDQYSTINPGLPRFLGRTKRFSLLKDHLMMRYCKSQSKEFDLFISIGTGMDFGRLGIQYFGFTPLPTLMQGAPAWYRGLKRPLTRVCESISRFSEDSMRRNVSLVNSRWTGEAIARSYGIPNYQVVPPPVNSAPNRQVWTDRQEGFLCVARIDPYKRLDQAIEIIKHVRENGFETTLRIVGRSDDANYLRRITQLKEENASWVYIDGVLAKDELFSLISSHKYGINASVGEPFGIAVAEMVKSGCIVFVADSGGQADIVGEPELTFNGTEDAVGKITKVLQEKPLQQSLLGRLEHRGKGFSSQAFCHGIREVLQDFFASESAATPVLR